MKLQLHFSFLYNEEDFNYMIDDHDDDDDSLKEITTVQNFFFFFSWGVANGKW